MNTDNLLNLLADVPTLSTQPTHCATVETPPPAKQSDLHKHVEELLSMVHSQQETINTLSAKLNFVLSFLGITDEERKETAGGVETPGLPVKPSESQSRNDQIMPSAAHSVMYASTVGAHALQGTRSDAAAHRQPSSFRDAVAAVVSAEQRSRECRAKTLIVTGLVPSAGNTDKIHFKRFCMMKLGIEPILIFMRRLSNDTGRVRPLLVCLPTEDDVLAITSNVKMLQNSVSARNMYINRNLCKEEVRLAYEARCRHHEWQQ